MINVSGVFRPRESFCCRTGGLLSLPNTTFQSHFITQMAKLLPYQIFNSCRPVFPLPEPTAAVVCCSCAHLWSEKRTGPLSFFISGSTYCVSAPNKIFFAKVFDAQSERNFILFIRWDFSCIYIFDTASSCKRDRVLLT